MVLQNYQSFLDELLKRVAALGIDVSGLNLDHIGYQTSSDEEYDRMMPEFLALGEKVHENLVGGRRVAIFKFPEPLKYKSYKIEAIELTAPKKDQVVTSQLDHAEFVIPETFKEFMEKYPKVDWDKSAVDQPTFPMLKIQLGDGLIVKFHYEPVLQIVKS